MGPLTEKMVSDFSKHLKDPEAFRADVERQVSVHGEVVRTHDVLAVDGSGDVLEREYFYADGRRKVLDSVQAGVRSL